MPTWLKQKSGIATVPDPAAAVDVHTVQFPAAKPAVLRGEVRCTCYDAPPDGDDDNLRDVIINVIVIWARTNGTFAFTSRLRPVVNYDSGGDDIENSDYEIGTPLDLAIQLNTDAPTRLMKLRLDGTPTGHKVAWTFGYTMVIGDETPPVT